MSGHPFGTIRLLLFVELINEKIDIAIFSLVFFLSFYIGEVAVTIF